MKIIILDGYTTNPGDVSWGALEALGELVVHDHTPADQTVARAAGAQIVLTNKTVLSREVLGQLPTLKYVGLLSTGTNAVDLKAAAERGVTVTNVPTYATAAVAQFTFALLLELCHRVGHHGWTVRQGKWSASRDFCYWEGPLTELEGKTLGVVGMGRIGQAVAHLGLAFGMQVLASDPAPPPWLWVKYVEMEELFSQSDVVSLHCPLTADNAGFVNAALIGRLKPSAFLINTARGPLIHEADLAAALAAGRLAGAAVDVLTVEPPPADNPLLSAPNCIITPHIAWAARASRERLIQTVADNLRAFLKGRPQNVVS